MWGWWIEELKLKWVGIKWHGLRRGVNSLGAKPIRSVSWRLPLVVAFPNIGNDENPICRSRVRRIKYIPRVSLSLALSTETPKSKNQILNPTGMVCKTLTFYIPFILGIQFYLPKITPYIYSWFCFWSFSLLKSYKSLPFLPPHFLSQKIISICGFYSLL